MASVFGHGRLRLYLLKLLEESPRHGYELIRLLRDRFMGLYAPSAGTIYPRLQRLEAEGLVTVTEVDGRKVYRLSEAGREELRRRRQEVADLEGELHAALGELRDSARDLHGEVDRTVRELLSRPKSGDATSGPRWDTFLSYLQRRAATGTRTGEDSGTPTEPDQPAAAAGSVTTTGTTATHARAGAGAGADTRDEVEFHDEDGVEDRVEGRVEVDTVGPADPRAVAAAFERRLQDFRDEVRDGVHDGVRDGEIGLDQLRECEAILAEAHARIRRALGRQHR